MQLDVEVSPPANSKGSSSTLKQNTFPSYISNLPTGNAGKCSTYQTYDGNNIMVLMTLI